MALTICRIEKIKSWGKLGGSEKHASRERETPNANPAVDNIRLIGKPDDPDLETMVKSKIGSQKVRSNAVLAVEILLSASPEYFRPSDPTAAGVYDQKRLEDFTDASTKWLLEQYMDRVVRAELHLDESTPHLHAYLVPLDEFGKLNCRAWFGGSRHKLSELQDSFAQAVQHLGIERGIKGSKATHTEVKDYYADVNRDSLNLNLEQQLPIPRPQESATDYRERVKETLQPSLNTINHQLSDRQRALQQKQELLETALFSERERQQLEERVKELEKEVVQWKAQANQLRDLSLEDVAYNLGLDSDDKGRNRWQGQGHIINIDGSKFYDFSREQRGGGGAIDLVMHVKECNFKQAVVWVHDGFGERGMLQAITHHAREHALAVAKKEPVPKFMPPVKDGSRWLGVQHYLTRSRKLPENWVKALHQQGIVYADSQQNAVFIQRSLDGDVTGAFLRGTIGFDNTFLGLAPGSKRSAGWFYVRSGGSETDLIQTAVLTKSPIDALSKAVLDSQPQTRTLYLAADSTRSLPLDFLKKMTTVVAAYDADPAGDQIARQIKQLLPQAMRVRPKALDWNQELVNAVNAQAHQNRQQDFEYNP